MEPLVPVSWSEPVATIFFRKQQPLLVIRVSLGRLSPRTLCRVVRLTTRLVATVIGVTSHNPTVGNAMENGKT